MNRLIQNINLKVFSLVHFYMCVKYPVISYSVSWKRLFGGSQQFFGNFIYSTSTSKVKCLMIYFVSALVHNFHILYWCKLRYCWSQKFMS